MRFRQAVFGRETQENSSVELLPCLPEQITFLTQSWQKCTASSLEHEPGKKKVAHKDNQ